MNLFDKSLIFVRIYRLLESLKKDVLRYVFRLWGEKKFDVEDNARVSYPFLGPV